MILVKKCKFLPNLILCQIVKNLKILRNLFLFQKGLVLMFDDVLVKKEVFLDYKNVTIR